MIGGCLTVRAGADRGVRCCAAVAAELALLVVALIIAAASGAAGVGHGTSAIADGAFGPVVTDALAALLAVALGIQNAMARKLAVPEMTTTVRP